MAAATLPPSAEIRNPLKTAGCPRAPTSLPARSPACSAVIVPATIFWVLSTSAWFVRWMALSGICGTDKHTYQGYTTQYAGTESARRIPFPIIQGHENVGTVELALASSVSVKRPAPSVTG